MRTGGAEKQKAITAKRFEDEGEKGKDRDEGENDDVPKCEFYLTKDGCRKAKDCSFSHNQKDEMRRCFTCGSSEHLSPSCPRKTGGSPNRPKAARVEAEDASSSSMATSKDHPAAGEDSEPQSNSSMMKLLEEANRMLKTPMIHLELEDRQLDRRQMSWHRSFHVS